MTLKEWLSKCITGPHKIVAVFLLAVWSIFAVVAMEFGGSSEDLARSFHSHPTMSEIIREAALAVDKRQRQGLAMPTKLFSRLRFFHRRA